VFGTWRATVIKKDDSWYATVDSVVFVAQRLPLPEAAAAMASV
jgi:hypothetical protein